MRWTTVAEAAVWWAALCALYLVLISAVGPLEFALGALAALLGTLAARTAAATLRHLPLTAALRPPLPEHAAPARPLPLHPATPCGYPPSPEPALLERALTPTR
ncbi:hypothetical protein [Kitasatospora sp. CB01950]|uniref:hypothetical protein n=1 Tax=Kitasatospora sp. CB01950 TaxID=1703930 RepID=UPI0009630D61|nr:hypothetical protein [Kitasatospora sp. CB01950]OKJ13791.1 hypothetical protein AMK19_10290 [Kitasatospora sp. CB01950]